MRPESGLPSFYIVAWLGAIDRPLGAWSLPKSITGATTQRIHRLLKQG